uniref:DUF2209 family protein n=1 Tax=Halegenticoccus soli TaxID=1985678 RepID=UPI001E340FEF
MVAAAVHAAVDSARIRSVEGMGFAVSRSRPTLDATLSVVAEAVGELPALPAGPVVAERGEFYERPASTVSLEFQPDFKYIESIAERETVRIAHHAAYAARELVR